MPEPRPYDQVLPEEKQTRGTEPQTIELIIINFKNNVINMFQEIAQMENLAKEII